MARVQAPALASLRVAAKVVLSWTPGLLLGERKALEARRAVEGPWGTEALLPSLPSQSWLTVLLLPLKLRTVPPLLLMVNIQAPALASVMVAEKVVLSCRVRLLLGER